MDFSLTEDQLAFVASARAFSEGVLAPNAARWDAESIFAKDARALDRVVQRSVEIKAEVVAQDEREAGKRAILNFGHTIGHAVEATSKYEVAHGEAVAIGMLYEARVAESVGIAPREMADRIARALERLHLPLELPDSNRADDLLEAMRADKKARAGQIRMALPTQVGRMHGSDGTGWTVAVDESSLRQVLVNR